MKDKTSYECFVEKLKVLIDKSLSDKVTRASTSDTDTTFWDTTPNSAEKLLRKI
jgi:hypothetical protein